MKKRVHMCISVRGVLHKDDSELQSEWCGVISKNDKPLLTVYEIRNAFMDELAQGREVIPMSSEPCEGFDFSGGGCPGHELPGEG